MEFRPLSGSCQFFEVWQSPAVWRSSKVRPSPKVFPSPDHRSVCHLTPGLSVTRLRSVRHPSSVCPSPAFGLSVTRPRSVRHPTLVCPSPDLGLSITQPWSVRHPTSVCPSPDLDCTTSRMSRRSRRLRHMDLDDSLDSPPPPPSDREAGASSPAPPVATETVVPAPSPVVLRVLPPRGSPALIGYIYDATPDADGGLLVAASAFFSFQGHQVFHDPCPDLAAYRCTRGVASSVVPVDRLPDHILSSGSELLDGLFAPSPTDLGTAFMSACLAPPPLAPPQPPLGDRSVASGLGSGRGIASVVRGIGVHGQSSAPPLGGLGAPGRPSAPLVGPLGRRPDPDDGVPALDHFHPFVSVPPSLGDVGVHPGVSVSTMGGLGVPSARVQAPSVMGGTGVPGGTSFLQVGNVGYRPDPDKGVPAPARSYHAPGPCPMASPRSLCGSPFPSSVAVSAPLSSRSGASLPSLVSFSGRSRDRSGARSSTRGYDGGRSSSSSSGPRGGALGRLSSSITPFLPLSVIGVRRVWSGMSPIGRSLHQMTFPFPRSRFRWTSLCCRPSSRARII